MGELIETWTKRLVEMAADGIDEAAARELVTEIWDAATLDEVDAYEGVVAEREAEREE
ncbi:hypothetical protein [Streptomyces sp. NBC_01803]|uniref:hypothetical protein n=1 Tax=Streptomyces sp. NBC_01803 TaxID=2975946 RepID=UPI002DD941EA|nr:hypothetical protein [Streptomyces sp. NBC_01803]WSA45698.1 hypothetical protein OIE51_16715 [Streptomyces sp. NBC_01803]